MQSFLLKEKTKKSYIESMLVYAYSSRASYQSALNRFEEFCNFSYASRTTEQIVAELKSIPSEQRDEAYFGVLQGYVNWLLRRSLSHKTVNNHFNIVNHYFSFNGIRPHPSELRRSVNRPKEIREKLHPLTLAEIHKIFSFAPEKRRMLYLVLIGSGMRIRECISLRKKDFDLNFPRRVKIDIPAIFTKTQTAHTTFVSKEASKYLISRLQSIQPNDLVFATNQDAYHASMTEIEAFTRYRDSAGLIHKYESANRHHITLHSFRSYFFTRARRVHDTDIAHALVGHTPYLDMYDRKDDEEKLDLYLQVEPHLVIKFKK